MRLCAGQPAPRASILNNNRYVPLRRSTCTSCLNPEQQPICASAPVNLHLVPQSSTTTDMCLCAGQPAPRASILKNNRYAPLRRSSCTSCLNSQQQPKSVSAPVILHLMPQFSTTTEKRLCAGHPAPRASILNDNRKASLRRSSCTSCLNSQQQPKSVSAPVILHLVPQFSTTTEKRLCAGHPVPRASTLYDTVIH